MRGEGSEGIEQACVGGKKVGESNRPVWVGRDSGGIESARVRGKEVGGIEQAYVNEEESGGIEHDTPYRQSYLETRESEKDSESDSEMSDRDARGDFVGYEDTESLLSSDEENLTSEEEEVRGRRYVRARSGRRVYGGRQQIRRGSGNASSSRPRSPIGTVGGERRMGGQRIIPSRLCTPSRQHLV